MTLDRALERSVKKIKNIPYKKKQSSIPLQPSHLILGNKGEEMAMEYLITNGYEIVDRNVRYRWGEIDIIANDPDSNDLVFVEVRTRSVGKIMPPDKTVGPNKLKKLIRSSRTWTETREYAGFWRIDLLAITVNEGQASNIEHIKNITEGIL